MFSVQRQSYEVLTTSYHAELAYIHFVEDSAFALQYVHPDPFAEWLADFSGFDFEAGDRPYIRWLFSFSEWVPFEEVFTCWASSFSDFDFEEPRYRPVTGYRAALSLFEPHLVIANPDDHRVNDVRFSLRERAKRILMQVHPGYWLGLIAWLRNLGFRGSYIVLPYLDMRLRVVLHQNMDEDDGSYMPAEYLSPTILDSFYYAPDCWALMHAVERMIYVLLDESYPFTLDPTLADVLLTWTETREYYFRHKSLYDCRFGRNGFFSHFGN